MVSLRWFPKVFAAVFLVICTAASGSAPAASQESSPTEQVEADRESRLARLFSELQEADTAAEANSVANQIWLIWTKAPDAQGRETMSALFAARRTRNLDKALELANKMTQRLPDYAEAWNQKATILFELGRFDRSLEAVEAVLDLEPRHFGALAGKAIILLRQGRVKLGQKALRRAVAIHPFLAERRFLVTPDDDAI